MRKSPILFFYGLLLAPVFAGATEFTSSSYQVLDPVIQPGGYSTSAGFQLSGVITQIGIGTSTSASREVRGGFLFFPTATTTIVSATAGDAQVALTWTADAFSAVADHYDVGQATITGGPYSFTNVGAVVTSARTGLTNGTTYYFVVRVMDSSSVAMATSSEVSATPVASAAAPTPTPTPTPGGGEGIVLSLLRLFLTPVPALPQKIPPGGPCGVDLNCDGAINLRDLSAFLYLSGKPSPNPADFNRDKIVDTRDLSVLFAGWSERLFAYDREVPKVPRSRYAEQLTAEANYSVATSARPVAENASLRGFWTRMQRGWSVTIEKIKTFLPSLIFRR